MSGATTLSRRSQDVPGAGDPVASAFITAPVSVDVRGVRALLERRGIRTFTADELDMPGRPLAEILQEGMSRADIVVGVLGAGGSSDNVFFELGFAQALKKRMLVLAPGDAPLATWASAGIPYVRADLTNPQAVEFAIAQVLKVPHQDAKRSAPARRTHPLGDAAARLCVRLGQATDQDVQRILDDVIVEAIQHSGVDAVSRSATSNGALELAVWSEDFEPWVNNPLLIEVRAKIGSSSAWEETTLALLRSMGATGVRWSLLIYARSSVDPAELVKAPNVLAISAEALLHALERTSFGELVRTLRNERVHGVR